MTPEDASTLLVQWLRQPYADGFTHYGYDVFLPSLLHAYFQRQRVDQLTIQGRIQEVLPSMMAAAWDLARRGILRPGVRSVGHQVVDLGSAGAGYSLTPFGQQWLQEAERDDYVPTEPGRFAQMLGQFHSLFGPGFQERAQEAVRCYGAHAYVACCAMSGAAAESILLSLATTKTNDAARVERDYSAASGRRRIENLLLGQARAQLADEFRGYMTLLKYWRDNSAHGRVTGISDNEAYTALALLLRLASFARDTHAELVAPP